MSSKKIELVGFDLHNYCTKQTETDGFICPDMQCEGCEYNKKYWLSVDGQGIDAEELEKLYEIKQHTAGNKFYIRLHPKKSAGLLTGTKGWLLGLGTLFIIIFALSYYYAVEYILK